MKPRTAASGSQQAQGSLRWLQTSVSNLRRDEGFTSGTSRRSLRPQNLNLKASDTQNTSDCFAKRSRCNDAHDAGQTALPSCRVGARTFHSTSSVTEAPPPRAAALCCHRGVVRQAIAEGLRSCRLAAFPHAIVAADAAAAVGKDCKISSR